MKLTRKSILLLAAALLVAGVAVWYAFLRSKSAGAVASKPGTDPLTGLPTSGTPSPAVNTIPDDVVFTPGPDDDPENPVRITVVSSTAESGGILRAGFASDESMLNLVLLGNRLVGRRGQIRNIAGAQPSEGMAFKYLVDNNKPWVDSIDALWIGINWPHTIECWEVDPNTNSDDWRVDGLRKGETTFTIQIGQGNYDY